MSMVNDFTPLIVGIDPGITTGIAFLDLEGQLIATHKKKNITKSKLVKCIADAGDPVIIACDIAPPPKVVEKVAASFSARLVAPKTPMTRVEKIRSTKEFLREAEQKLSIHEKDALAAALLGWKSVQRLVARIDKKLRDAEVPEAVHKRFSDEVKRTVLVGRKSIDASLKQVRPRI